jgi:tripartite-type tricarboxylate transporter receptor subunit TctC
MGRVERVAAVLALALVSACGWADDYPSRPIRLVIPFTAGGGTDIAGRVVAARLADRLNTTIVIDNRTGAGGIVGTEIVSKAAPDGYTLVLVSSSHAINPSLRKRMPYDAIRDFTPVTLFVYSPGMLVVNPVIPATSVKDFIAYVRSKPGQLSYGSAGTGTPVHLAMELLKSLAHIDIVHVPYKGAADGMNDLIAGRVVAMIPSAASVLPHVKSGKLHGLAVTSRARTAAAPDIPTMIEAGVPNYDAASWYALLAPAGTPRAIVQHLATETATVLKQPEVRDRLVSLGMDPVGNTPQELAGYLREEIAKWRRVVQASGAKID